MGIVRGFALGVVLAVDRDPLLGDHAGGQPQPEAEEVAHPGVQVQRPMGLSAVQKNGDGNDGNVSQDQAGEDRLQGVMSRMP